MSSFEENGPGYPITESIRVDKVKPRARIGRQVRAVLVVIVAIVLLVPVVVMGITAFKSRSDVVSVPPKLIFDPTLEGFVFLFYERSQLSGAALEEARANADELGLVDRVALQSGQRVTGPSDFAKRLVNSLIIAFGATAISVFLGLLAAYAFSRFDVPGADDLLFFILSGRMLPAVVVTIPIFLMYRQLGLHDTHLGMILVYTVFNLSLTVWLLKGFIDEIPREYEEAALIDGYTRFQAFTKVVLPQAATGIASTAIFCLIFAWNEYAFAVLLTSGTAQTAPPFIPTIIGVGGQDWPAVAAGATIFLVPVMVFTILLRKHLLRGITFGAVRK